jgi:hypothetical protein
MQEGKDPYTMYTIHDHLQLANYLVSQADKIQMRDKFHLIPMDFLKEPITSFMESPGMEPISPFMKIPGKEPQGRAQPVLPAISIPLENKEQGYECPQDHLDHLTRSLSKVDKLLIVGWKAAEKDFVTLLTMGLPKDIQKAIVSSSLESAKRTCSKLTSSGLEREGWFLGEEGFTNLIQSGWIENFVSGLGEPY